jgi:hypothetical protein
MGLSNVGDTGARIILDGHGLLMAVGLGQQIFGELVYHHGLHSILFFFQAKFMLLINSL